MCQQYCLLLAPKHTQKKNLFHECYAVPTLYHMSWTFLRAPLYLASSYALPLISGRRTSNLEKVRLPVELCMPSFQINDSSNFLFLFLFWLFWLFSISVRRQGWLLIGVTRPFGVGASPVTFFCIYELRDLKRPSNANVILKLRIMCKAKLITNS